MTHEAKHNYRSMLEAALTLVDLQSIAADHTLLNVSHDATRELYTDYNELFVAYWKRKTGSNVIIQQCHGASGCQANAVVGGGLKADVVTLAQAHDVDSIAERTDRLSTDWRNRLPNNSVPFTSTVVFVVRKGNPKGIRDWGDLVRPGVSVVTPNPQTSGGARWNHLAAWAFASRSYGCDIAAREFVSKLYENVTVLDPSATSSRLTFDQREMGDVLLSWECEALRLLDEQPDEAYEIIAPSISMLAELPVCVAEKTARKRNVFTLATAYLEHMYSPAAQRIIAKHYLRPCLPAHAAREDLARFSNMELISVDEEFGGWQKVHNIHFAKGGIVDEIFVSQILMKAFDHQTDGTSIRSRWGITPDYAGGRF